MSLLSLLKTNPVDPLKKIEGDRAKLLDRVVSDSSKDTYYNVKGLLRFVFVGLSTYLTFKIIGVFEARIFILVFLMLFMPVLILAATIYEDIFLLRSIRSRSLAGIRKIFVYDLIKILFCLVLLVFVYTYLVPLAMTLDGAR